MAVTFGNIYPVCSGGYYPGYNDVVVTATSNNTSQPNFKYVVDLYVSGTQVLRQKYSPDAAGRLTSNLHRIIEAYLGSDIDVADDGFKRCSSSIKQVTFQIGEEYGSTPTVYPNLSSGSIYAFNAALDLMERLDFNDSSYLTDGSSAAFLSSQSSFDIFSSQNAWVHMIRDTSNKPAKMQIETFSGYSGGGASLGKYRISNPYATLSVTSDRLLRFPSGTYNIGLISSGSITVVSGALPIIAASVKSYVLTPLDNSNNAVGAGVVYNVRDSNCKYSNYRLHFLNKYGGFDSMNFPLVSRASIQPIERKTYRKVYGSNSSGVWSYSKGDVLEPTFDIQGNKKVKIQSDWMTDSQASWLEELMLSPLVYLETSPTVLSQVSLIDTSYEIKTKAVDKLIALAIEFRYPYNKKRQRG